MPKDIDLDFEFEDEKVPQRPKRQAPPREVGPSQQGMQRGGAPARRKKNNNQMTSIIILAVEVVVFIALIVLFFVLKGKINSTDTSAAAASGTESGQQAGQNGGTDVDSDEFRLKCTKVKLAQDANGSPAALIYFTFENKTDTPLSMNEVFQPSLTQNGQACSTDITLTDTPAEIENKDMQVTAGQSVECCYAFGLSDLTSPITLTMHDNYSTYSDIGSTEIPISST